MIATDRKARLAFGMVLGVVIGVAAGSYWATHQLMAVQKSLLQSQVTRTILREILFDLTVADSARNAYLQHRDNRDLRLYYSALSGVSPRVGELRPLLRNSPTQQRTFARFQHSVDERLTLLRQSLWPESNGPAHALHPVAMTSENGTLVEETADLAGQLDNGERERLQTLRTESRKQYRYAVGSLTLETTLSLLFLAVVFHQGAREQKQRIETEEALTETQEGFRSLVESVKDYAIFMLDTEGRVVSWNAGAERIEGYWPSEILGHHFSRFYTDEDVAQGRPERCLRIAADKGKYEEEAWRVRKDGSHFWANAVVTPLRDDAGQVRGFAKIIRDISERKQVEEELQRREELMNAFFRTTPVGLAIFDTEFRCQKLNSTLCAMTGQTVEGSLGKTAVEVLCELGPQVEGWLRKVAATGKPILNQELMGRKPNEPSESGHWITSCFPVANRNGELYEFGLVMLDITERTKAEEALRESEAMLRGLSGRLLKLQDAERRRLARELHDGIGQCLAALKINLEILEKDTSTLALDAKVTKALSESLALADQCLNDTRTVSHLLHPPLLDQVGLLSALRWYVQGFVERSDIRVQLDVPDDFSRLPADLETTLFRVVQESLTNIHRHSGSPAANIRLTSDAESVSVEVTDYGRGIPPEQLRRCNGNWAALGVGIAGMRERVRQLGGQLQVSSNEQRTTVAAILPVGGDA
ncbi:MAG TPA: PAS domain S-box protein [Terriglobales bacterium]|nr:PAS domain S-box protein [Terriglobales bacterium]